MWRAGPTTLPAGHGHGSPACRQDTALVLTRRAGHGCSVRHSIGLRAVSPHRQASQLSPRPLCFLSLMTTAFTACSRPCREYAASAVESFFLKAVWLSLSFVPDDGNGHTAFFGRCRGERPVFLGESNHSPQKTITSFIRVAMLLPSGALDCSHCKGISCPSCGLGIHAALVKIFLSGLRAYFPNSST